MQNFNQWYGMVMKGNGDRELNILAVDDEPSILELYQQILSPLNDHGRVCSDFDLTLCNQGDEAVTAVRKAISKGERFAVIFLDLKLSPGPDGMLTGAQIRKLDPDVNFVIATGLLGVDPRDITSHIPPKDKIMYIQKPFNTQEIRQFAAALGAKWQSEMLLKKTNIELEKKVEEMGRIQKELLDNQWELESVNNQLLETNNALSVLARNLDRTRKESERQVLKRIRTLIMPIIENLRQGRDPERYQTDLDLLSNYVKNLTSDLANDIKKVDFLSASELRITSMIKNGMTSEEIARHLCISPATVKTHRKNIRKKLNLQNSGVNMKTYFESEID